jgi:integrase
MSGTLRERRPGVYEYRVSLGRDPATGKYHSISRTIRASTKKELEREQRRILAEVDEERHKGSTATLEELLDRWLDHIGPDRSPKYIETMRGSIRSRIAPALGRKQLRKLTTLDLDVYYAALRKAGLSPATVRRHGSIIRGALKQAKKWGLVPVNVAVDATMPPARKPAIHSPTPDQVRALIEAAERRGPEWATYLFLAAASGARRGELCALSWSDLDIELGQLRISRSVGVTKATGLYVKDTKTHQERSVTLDPGTLHALDRHRAFMLERAKVAGVKPLADAYVFSDAADAGVPWDPDRISGQFRRLRDRVGLGDVRLHDLRHFMASMLADDNSIPIGVISARLGHALKSTTLNMYVHNVDGQDVAAAAVLGARLAGALMPRADAGALPA